MNWNKITKDEKVKQLLIDRMYIEQEIKRLDENALIMYELEVLSIPDVVVPKGTLCETCQGKGQYYAGTLIGYVNCPDCNE